MQPPQLPALVRALNTAGRAAQRLGMRPISLDPEHHIRKAEQRTGVSAPADPSWREGLVRLTEALESEAHLHLLGRVIARAEIERYLDTRFQLERWCTKHPEIERVPVRRPLFIIGQARTGTSILHELLALDPNKRVPLSWECETPFPPPERKTFDTDPRIVECQKRLDETDRLITDFKRIHRMGATLPQECIRLGGASFRSSIMAAAWHVPSYLRWLLHDADMAPFYALHARMLQVLQWRCPGERWVLKSPGHLWHLNDLLERYPDAGLIQTHRDPLQSLSSITSLLVVLRAMSSDRVDAQAIAREWAEQNALGYLRSVEVRQRRGMKPKQTLDLNFRRFMRDPVASVREIYAHFDLELPPEVESRMRDYVANNPHDRDGKHVHRFSDTGLDPHEERERLRPYLDYFDVDDEALN